MNITPIILAAGKGTRMRTNIPKVLIPFKGKPIIKHLLESLSHSNIKQTPVIVVPQNDTLISSHVSNCMCVNQQAPKGTGDAALAGIVHVNTSHVLILYGDHPNISSPILNQFTHLNNAHILIGTVHTPHFNGWYHTFNTWGRIIRKNNTIIKVTEHKDATPEELLIKEINASPYLFETQWLKQTIPTLTSSNRQRELYITDLIEKATQQNMRVQAIPIPPIAAIGINTQKQLRQAEAIFDDQQQHNLSTLPITSQHLH